MGIPYISEIRLMSFTFAPRGWALCNGQTMAIQQNQALFSLLGTTYGGDGIRTFQLPNLQGRTPLHFGNSFSLGQAAGESTHTLSYAEMPAHSHALKAYAGTATSGGIGDQPGPSVVLAEAFVFGETLAVPGFATGSPNFTLAAGAIGPTGGQPHPNMQPYLVLNYCIALEGIYPSRN
jgi:microcystin-dependent protein